MFHRTIEERLAAWRSGSGRKPVLVRGARQVGKTVAVRRFGEQFEHFIELNLERAGDRALFEQGLEATQVYQAAALRKRIAARPESTLLFLDEIQECPAAVQALRYFCEDMPEMCVVAAGSLLEVALANAEVEFPVGRVQHLVMYPLSFAEFLTALGETAAADALAQLPVPVHAAGRLMELFHCYALVGGMPEVVARYAETHDPVGLQDIYESLLQSYVDDVPKYARNNALARVLDHCIRSAPLEAGNRIAFAGFGQSNYRSREVAEAMRTLEKALLVHLRYPTTATQLPLRQDQRKRPRLQFLDTGLLNYVAQLQDQHLLHADLHAFYRGLVAEHVVGQELLSSRPSLLHKPSFWVREKSQSNAEVDFLIPHRGRAVPVEVKAGKTGRMRSLAAFVDAGGQPYAVRLYAGPFAEDRLQTPGGTPFTLYSLPYFLAARLSACLDCLLDGGKPVA